VHRSLTECQEILDDIMISTDFTIRSESLREERKMSQEDLPEAESNPLPFTSFDSTIGPSPKPGTSEEEEIQPPEFFSRFQDDSSGSIRNTSNHYRHEKPTTLLCPYKAINEISQHTPAMDWSNEVRRTSEVVQISPTSTTISCCIRGNTVDAFYNPVAEVCIMFEYLMDTLVGNKPLTPTNTYFRSPSELFFECQGITRDVLIITDKNRGVLRLSHLG